MNDLQNKQYEILGYFVKVCKELDLKYYLVCGSALGAAKYNGFIPWDDDVDVALPRKDYNVFCERAQEILPEWIFLQNYKTDKNFPKIFTKLRNINTTYIESPYKDLDICHGIFIDVFPLDGYPSDEKEIKIFEKRKRAYLRKTSCTLSDKRSFKSNLLRKIYQFLGYQKKIPKLLSEYENMITSYDDSEVYCNYGNFRGKLKLIPKNIYGRGSEKYFGDIIIKVPYDYKKYLEIYYNNWEDDIPEEEKVGHHYYEIMDLNNSYKKYIR